MHLISATFVHSAAEVPGFTCVFLSMTCRFPGPRLPLLAAAHALVVSACGLVHEAWIDEDGDGKLTVLTDSRSRGSACGYTSGWR